MTRRRRTLIASPLEWQMTAAPVLPPPIQSVADHSITVLTNEYDNFPLWSQRGDLIAFIRKIGDDFEVFTIRPDGKDVNQLTHTKGNAAHLEWSPDGERIAFTSSRMGSKTKCSIATPRSPTVRSS